MKSSTESQRELDDVSAESSSLLLDWEQVKQVLPGDLEASAKASQALVRRRGVQCASDLLRMILAYAVCDWPLRLVAAWCVLQGLADISDVAVLNRLRNSCTWLGRLLLQLLEQRQLALPQRPVCLQLVDATVISRPGSCGSDWRVHVSLDLNQMLVRNIELTSARGGETLARFPGQAGEICVADRGYAFASSLAPLLVTQRYLVVRLNWQNLPLQDAQGHKLDLIAWLRQASAEAATALHERPVWLTTAQGPCALRLLAQTLPAEAAERARQRARQAAAKKKRTPQENTLFACGFVLILTNLPASQWAAAQVLDLYRLRWQVELLFKRLKSLLCWDGLRAHDPQLARAYLLGKVLALLLLEALTGQISNRAPAWLTSVQRPISHWRLTALLWEHLRHIVRGTIPGQTILTLLPRLQRFLCDAPRHRPQQLAYGRLFLDRLSDG